MAPTFTELLDCFICFDGAKINLAFNLNDNPEKLDLMTKFDEFSKKLRAIRYEHRRRNLNIEKLLRQMHVVTFDLDYLSQAIIVSEVIQEICDDILGHLPPLTSIDVDGVEKGNLH